MKKIKKMKIGIFGCGNMGRALGLGIKESYPEVSFYLYNKTPQKALDLGLLVNGISFLKIEEMPINLDWYILAFKPQNLSEFEFNFDQNAKIISLLAAVNLSTLKNKFPAARIMRLMPNTPLSIGAGASLLFFDSLFSLEEKAELQLLLNKTGKLFLMDSEEKLDLVTVFSGSGPGLIFEIARIFEAELISLGENNIKAKEIVAQTFLGSAALLNYSLTNGTSFEELKNQVTSKKGVTYEALEVLKKHQLQSIFKEAFKAGILRINEISKL